MSLTESPTQIPLASGTTENADRHSPWRSEPSGWQSKLCHRPSSELRKGLKSHSHTKPSGKSVSSYISNISNTSIGSNVSSGSNASSATSSSSSDVHNVEFDKSQSSPETASALTIDLMLSSGCNGGLQSSYEQKKSPLSGMHLYSTSSHNSCRTGPEAPCVDTTWENSAHKTTPNQQHQVDNANTYTACGSPDSDEQQWISAEKEFETDPAHQFWSWDGNRWFHRDEETGSMIFCPSELD